MDEQKSEIHAGEERRKTPRKETKFHIKYMVRGEPEKKEKAQFKETTCVHIGGGGLCMYADSPYQLDTKLLLIIALPNCKDTIVVEARVVYAKRASENEGGEHRIGLQYVDLKKTDLKLIMDFIKSQL